MYQLLRNHTHGSEILLSIYKSGDVSFVKKSSYLKAGIEDLKRELSGFKWYSSKINSPFDLQVSEIDGVYFELKIPFLDAEQPIRRQLNTRNLKYYVAAIDHYNRIWDYPVQGNIMVPVHGDYSLDGNILFVQGRAFILDWEHFRICTAPRGFDVLFLIFEAINIACGSRIPDKKLLTLGKKLVNHAIKIGALDSIFKTNTFEVFLLEQSKIDWIWGKQKDKIPTNQFSPTQLKKMRLVFDKTA